MVGIHGRNVTVRQWWDEMEDLEAEDVVRHMEVDELSILNFPMKLLAFWHGSCTFAFRILG